MQLDQVRPLDLPQVRPCARPWEGEALSEPHFRLIGARTEPRPPGKSGIEIISWRAPGSSIPTAERRQASSTASASPALNSARPPGGSQQERGVPIGAHGARPQVLILLAR